MYILQLYVPMQVEATLTQAILIHSLGKLMIRWMKLCSGILLRNGAQRCTALREKTFRMAVRDAVLNMMLHSDVSDLVMTKPPPGGNKLMKVGELEGETIVRLQ